MGNYTIVGGFENLRRGRQARNLTTNVPKILDLKSSSEQIFSKNCRWVPLIEQSSNSTIYRLHASDFEQNTLINGMTLVSPNNTIAFLFTDISGRK